MPEFETTKMA